MTQHFGLRAGAHGAEDSKGRGRPRYTIGAQLATGTLNAFLGITRGTGATNPGAAVFSPADGAAIPNGTDMLYNFGLSGTLAPGISTINFAPNGFGGYDWTSS
jgi:hypothetical protein